LRDGRGVEIDLAQAAHFLKLSADQANPDAQNAFASLLHDGKGIAMDRIGAAHYLRLAADQGVGDAQYRLAISLIAGDTCHHNLGEGIQLLKLSAENGSAKGQFTVGWMAEFGVGVFSSTNLEIAVDNYKRSSVVFPAGAACFGRCLGRGLGIPVDFTIAAEFLKAAADSGDVDGANWFGCCLERGQGVDKDIDSAVFYYESTACLSHPDGIFNFGRCLEYGIGMPRDESRAAKYYRLSAEQDHAAAQNSFGICLERGIGVHKNVSLAALFYQRSARQVHADGANNFGFCLEHGRGVEQNIEMAAEYYKFAADHGHSEANLNFSRCLRLLGQWEPPDRSSEQVSNPPSVDRLSHMFTDLFKSREGKDDEERRFINSFDQLKAAVGKSVIRVGRAVERFPSPIGIGDWGIVRFSSDCKSRLNAVKTVLKSDCAEFIRREAAILKSLNHPLILKLREAFHGGASNLSIVTELAGNGSLADHFPFGESGRGRGRGGGLVLSKPNRVARIAVGIALAMRYLHSCGVIHRDLTPANILLDWEWRVRIADFGRSLSPETPPLIQSKDNWPLFHSHYRAPECYDGECSSLSDVFSFGLILYELLTGQSAFPRTLGQWQIEFRVVVTNERPEIPESVLPSARDLIADCWAVDPDDRPPFAEIVDRLVEMNFRVMENVNSVKLAAFVEAIEGQAALDAVG
jgi:TPR repeat protein